MPVNGQEAVVGVGYGTRTRTAWPRVVAVAITAVAVLAGGFVATQWLAGRPTARVPPAVPVSPTGESVASQAWTSAIVARDDTTVTVYAGTERCHKLAQPHATVAAQDASQVSVALTAQIVDADCETSGRAVPVVATLPVALAGRTLVDAATGQPRPVFFERHLPDLRSDGRWSAIGSSWQAGSAFWAETYNGPAGSSLDLLAYPTARPGEVDSLGAISLGPYQGTLTRGAGWTVTWEVGEVTYELRLIPSEGGSFTREEFEQELARLTWR